MGEPQLPPNKGGHASSTTSVAVEIVSAVRVTIIRVVEPIGTTLGPIGFHCGKPEPYKTEKVIAHGPALLTTQHGRVQGVAAVGQPYVTTSRSDQPRRQQVHAR